MLNEQLRSLPYVVHTNRELGLMLAGAKKLATFVEGEDRWLDSYIRYFRLFDRQVAIGRLIRRDRFVDAAPGAPVKRWHYVYFTLPREEWRIDAMIELVDRPGPWSDEREFEQDRLFGYEDWQNDVWAALIAANRAANGVN